MVRLVMLLACLGLVLVAVSSLGTGPDAAQRQRLSAPAEASPPLPEQTTELTQVLPASIRRLADSPVSGPSRPVVIGTAEPLPQAAPVIPASTGTWSGDIRRVSANGANVRGGPSTRYEVVGRLIRNDEVEVIEDGGNGWLHIRVQGDGVEGWIAASLLAG